MEFILHRFRNLTILVIVIAAQLLLLAYQVKSSQDVRLIRVWAVTAVMPLARAIEFVRGGTVDAVSTYFLLAGAREENKRLKAELARLKLEKHFLENELATAQRAQALAVFQTRTPSKTLAARIIGTGPGVNSKVVFIDRGLGSGVMKGMAVVTPDGIVGKVIAAYPTASQVMLITDASFAAGVISQKNRVHGTVKGMGQSNLTVEYVQSEQKVEVGEMFYTSGDDRIFPKGLPVGVATVVREGKNLTKEIFLTPSAFQKGLEEVLVVIEGIHQDIPELTQAPPQPIYALPAPPPEAGGETASESAGQPKLNTEADRLRERYRRIGEAQGHVFGEGAPGSRPPNFNLPDPARAQPAQEQPGGAAPPRPPAGQGRASGIAPPPAKTAPPPAGAKPPAGAAGREASPAPAKPVPPRPAAPAPTKPRAEDPGAQVPNGPAGQPSPGAARTPASDPRQ